VLALLEKLGSRHWVCTGGTPISMIFLPTTMSDGVTGVVGKPSPTVRRRRRQNVREKGGIYYRNEAVYQPGRMYLGASKRAVPGEEPWGASVFEGVLRGGSVKAGSES